MRASVEQKYRQEQKRALIKEHFVFIHELKNQFLWRTSIDWKL